MKGLKLVAGLVAVFFGVALVSTGIVLTLAAMVGAPFSADGARQVVIVASVFGASMALTWGAAQNA